MSGKVLLAYKTKAELVYEALREEILSGQLRPNDRVSVKEVSERMGVSRQPIREILSRLQAEGLVVIEPHKEVRVAPISLDDVEEAYAMRSVLEGLAARRVCGTLNAKQFDELGEILKELDAKAEAGDTAGFGPLNTKFHMTIYKNTSQGLVRALRENFAQTLRCRALFVLAPEWVPQSQAEHHEIFALLREGEAAKEKVEDLVRRHTDRAARLFLDLMQERQGDEGADIS